MSYIEVRNVYKSYGEKEVLKGVDLHVKKGTLVTLLGPSGCGKSTLLRCLAGLEPYRGNISIDEKLMDNIKPEKREIGMIFQNYSLFPHMTVYENISFGLKRKGFSKKVRDKKIENIIEVVNLRDCEKKYPYQLSGGERQRTALARSIVIEPKVLLFDEPLSAIDAKLRKQLQEEIRSIQKNLGITSIFVTHDQEEAMEISDLIYVMNEGWVEQVGTAMELYENPKTNFVADFIGEFNVLEKEDAEKIWGKEFSVDSVKVRVRPEHVKLSATAVMKAAKGRIEEVVPLGNTIRYVIRVDDIHLKSILLFEEGNKYKEGQEVWVFIEEENFRRVF